jgi:hypothetical protein
MAIRRSATKRNGLPTTVQLRLTPAPAEADALAAAVLLCNEAATAPPCRGRSAVTVMSARCGSGGAVNVGGCRGRGRLRRGGCCAACPVVSTG